jgi:hypothetical protein
MVWAIEHPDRGLVLPDDLDFRRVLEVARPYLGDVVGHYTTWNPLYVPSLQAECTRSCLLQCTSPPTLPPPPPHTHTHTHTPHTRTLKYRHACTQTAAPSCRCASRTCTCVTMPQPRQLRAWGAVRRGAGHCVALAVLQCSRLKALRVDTLGFLRFACNMVQCAGEGADAAHGARVGVCVCVCVQVA